MAASCGAGVGVFGILDGTQELGSIQDDSMLHAVIEKIMSIVNINNAAAVLYFLQDVTGPAEVGAVLSALAAQRLVARVLNCFYD